MDVCLTPMKYIWDERRNIIRNSAFPYQITSIEFCGHQWPLESGIFEMRKLPPSNSVTWFRELDIVCQNLPSAERFERTGDPRRKKKTLALFFPLVILSGSAIKTWKDWLYWFILKLMFFFKLSCEHFWFHLI